MYSMVLRVLPFSFVFSFAEGRSLRPGEVEVCYGRLGCFYNVYPFDNSDGKLPSSPEVIDTKLFRFVSPNEYEELMSSNPIDQKPVKMIIPGYQMSEISAEESWVQVMAQELLAHASYNVIVVDWHKGAKDSEYMQTVANTRVVGAVVALQLKTWRDVNGIDLSNVHIIGFDLGAHIAGYIGNTMQGMKTAGMIGRISGLDPAGPGFEDTGLEVRLDKSDALFVDVIHTDIKPGFGLEQSVGTVDFYPNEGSGQPGCNMDLLVVDERLRPCSHQRAVEYFIESINSRCDFQSYPCDNYELASECNPCGIQCGIMGFRARPSMHPGKCYLQTNVAKPYCMGYLK